MAAPLQDCAVLLGDSLTQEQRTPGNLHQRISEAYCRKLDVLNRGFGGWNSNGTRVLLDRIFAKKGAAAHAPVVRLVTIWLGTNDSVLPPHDRNVPLSRFIDNLNYILWALTSADSPYAIADTPVSIVLITPGPCLTSMFEDYTVKWRTVESTRSFRDAVLQVGREWKAKEMEQEAGREGGRGWKVEVVDFWSDLVEAAGGEGEELRPYMTDGVHFTSAGYDVVWAGVAKAIKEKMAGRGLDWEDDDDLPMRVPAAKSVNWGEPESLLEQMKLPPFCLQE